MSASYTQLQSISVLPKRNKWQIDAVSGSSIVGAFFYWFLQWFLPFEPWDLICQISFFCFFIITPTVDETLLCWSKTGGSLQGRQVWWGFFSSLSFIRDIREAGIPTVWYLSSVAINETWFKSISHSSMSLPKTNPEDQCNCFTCWKIPGYCSGIFIWKSKCSAGFQGQKSEMNWSHQYVPIDLNLFLKEILSGVFLCTQQRGWGEEWLLQWVLRAIE